MSSSSSAESASIRAICCISAEDGDCLFPVPADVEADEVDPEIISMLFSRKKITHLPIQKVERIIIITYFFS